MYSTLRGLTRARPRCDGQVCGKYAVLPPSPARVAEGGLRTCGQYKASLAASPLVSIVTCVYNGGKYLEKCINSVLAQTWDNIEHIVIDGASGDNTLAIINANAPAIDYFVSEPDRGLYDAMNKGLSLALGKYILILNSDDWYDPAAVEKLVTAVESTDADFSCALAVNVNAQGEIVSHVPHLPFDDFVYLRMPLRHELMLVPAKWYERLGGYDPAFAIIADLEMTQRMRSHGLTCNELREELLFFRTDGLSSRMALLVEERKILLKRNFPFLSDADCQLLAEIARPEANVCSYFTSKYKDSPRFTAAFDFWIKCAATTRKAQ